MSSPHLQRGTPEMEQHMRHVKRDVDAPATSRGNISRLDEEIATAPLFSLAASEALKNKRQDEGISRTDGIFPQYGLLGLRSRSAEDPPSEDDLVYTNVSAPWSAFICGSQGSGKSHTLSCILENSLIQSSPVGRLSSPLAGLVLHYDKFTAYSSMQLCEAAYLYSSKIPVRVLVSPTNYLAMKKAYTQLSGGSKMLKVLPLYLPQKDLNVSMMKTLMGINNKADQPLYIEVVMKTLRDMAIENQGRAGFNYPIFKLKLERQNFVKGQLMPLNMRLDVLESFFEPGAVPGSASSKAKKHDTEDIWKFSAGTLTIIDLSCPFVGPEDACALFNIALSLFLKDRQDVGRIIALDEAHKFLTSTSPEAIDLTETLLSIVRQQRHLAARVLIATQEPTLAPSLLELCNVTIIHRFSSPAWFKAIKSHIAGAGVNEVSSKGKAASEIFHKIVRLSTGEALVFCPTALLDVEEDDGSSEDSASYGDSDSSDSADSLSNQDRPNDEDSPESEAKSDSQGEADGPCAVQLGTSYAHIRVRKRITVDGGRSVLEY